MPLTTGGWPRRSEDGEKLEAEDGAPEQRSREFEASYFRGLKVLGYVPLRFLQICIFDQ